MTVDSADAALAKSLVAKGTMSFTKIAATLEVDAQELREVARENNWGTIPIDDDDKNAKKKNTAMVLYEGGAQVADVIKKVEVTAQTLESWALAHLWHRPDDWKPTRGGRGTKLNDEEMKELQQHYEAGLPNSELEEKYKGKISLVTIMNYAKKGEWDTSQRVTRTRFAPDATVISRMRDMFNRDSAYSVIASEVGASPVTVTKWIGEHGEDNGFARTKNYVQRSFGGSRYTDDQKNAVQNTYDKMRKLAKNKEYDDSLVVMMACVENEFPSYTTAYRVCVTKD